MMVHWILQNPTKSLIGKQQVYMSSMICTCKKDVDGMMGMLNAYGLAPSEEDAAKFFGSCSEAAGGLNTVAAWSQCDMFETMFEKLKSK